MALTVLGRPPGLTQIPLSEAESEMLGVSISSPNSPATERPYSPQDRFSAQPSWVRQASRLLVEIRLLHLNQSVQVCLLLHRFALSVCSQDENNSVCNQRVDYSMKMLPREQQDLQVRTTSAPHFILCAPSFPAISFCKRPCGICLVAQMSFLSPSRFAKKRQIRLIIDQ